MCISDNYHIVFSHADQNTNMDQDSRKDQEVLSQITQRIQKRFQKNSGICHQLRVHFQMQKEFFSESSQKRILFVFQNELVIGDICLSSFGILCAIWDVNNHLHEIRGYKQIAY